jgi:hypothetical protein
MNRLFFVAALTLAGAASPAFAADPAGPAAAVPAPGITGYIEATAVASVGESEWGYNWLSPGYDDWTGAELGGAGRVAVPVTPELSLQFDAWAAGRRETGDGCDYDGGSCGSWDDDDQRYGGAVHLAHKLDGAVIGGMVSLGSTSERFEELYATVALEGSVAIDQLRLTGQVGVTRGITDWAEYYEHTILYAQGDVAYYLDPNLRISGTLGLSRFSWAPYDSSDINLIWGARIEQKLADSPVSLFAAYEGMGWQGENMHDWEWSAAIHTVRAGIRIAFGEESSTLQDLDSAVPFRDMNPEYGIDY